MTGRRVDADRLAAEALRAAGIPGTEDPDPDATPGAGPADPTAGDVFIDWPAFWAQERDDDAWLLDGVLARGRGHAIYAPRKGKKSLFTLWAVVELMRAGVLVLYFDYEMTEGDVEERLLDLGEGPDTDLSLLRYALLPVLDPLDTAAGGEAFLALVDREAFTHPTRDVVVVIDTIGRATAGEENSNDTIRDFYRYTGLGLKQRGVTYARLDHAGKDLTRGQRGASAKGDDVDIAWRVVVTEAGGVDLHRDLARMRWVPEKVTFACESDPLRFVRSGASWPAGTLDTANALDDLGVPLDAPVRAAMAALKDAGKGRRRDVVAAALRWRRDRSETPPQDPGNAPGDDAPDSA